MVDLEGVERIMSLFLNDKGEQRVDVDGNLLDAEGRYITHGLRR